MGKRARGVHVRQTSTTTVTIWDSGTKYERPVDMKPSTLAGYKSVGVLRKGAGVRG